MEMRMEIEILALDCNNNKIHVKLKNERRGEGGGGRQRKMNTKNAVCIWSIHHKLSQLMCQNNRFIVPLSALVLSLFRSFLSCVHTHRETVSPINCSCVIFQRFCCFSKSTMLPQWTPS